MLIQLEIDETDLRDDLTAIGCTTLIDNERKIVMRVPFGKIGMVYERLMGQA